MLEVGLPRRGRSPWQMRVGSFINQASMPTESGPRPARHAGHPSLQAKSEVDLQPSHIVRKLECGASALVPHPAATSAEVAPSDILSRVVIADNP